MEEAQQILLNSLSSSGICLPEGFSSLKSFTPSFLISICAQALHLIDQSLLFPTSLPESVAERFKICTEVASCVKNLGFIGELSFHQFLYPSEEDSYKLVRFLVERLSQISESENISAKKETDARVTSAEVKSSSTDWTEKVDKVVPDLNYQTVNSRLKDLTLNTNEGLDSYSLAEEVPISGPLEGHQLDEPASISVSGSLESTKEEPGDGRDNRSTVETPEDSRVDESEESKPQRNDLHINALKQKLASLQEQSSKLRHKIDDLQSQGRLAKEELTTKTVKFQLLEREHDLLKAAVDMALDDQHPIDFYVEQLNKQIDEGKHKLMELESNWNASSQSLGEKKRNLEELLHTQNPDVQEKLKNVKEIEQETEAIISEIQKKEEEQSKLSAELENQPKVASRKSFIQRITEITKNSRKQDADIERILKDTRDLQLESNSIQERLHRTYAIVDETMSRGVKKDPVRMQAYKLLTSIHESFEQISEKILVTDRTRREVAEQEAKLASVSTRNLDINKLQADLDAIKKENEVLEQQLSHR